MALASFPSGCWFLTLLFCIMALFIDSLFIQSGTSTDEDTKESMTYYVIWKTNQLRIISVSDTSVGSDETDSVTNIGTTTIISTEMYLDSLAYTDIYNSFCVSSNIVTDSNDTTNNLNQIINSNSNQKESKIKYNPKTKLFSQYFTKNGLNRNLLSSDLSTKACEKLETITLLSNITSWMIWGSILIVVFTMILYLIIKLSCFRKCRRGCLRYILRICCFISSIVILGTIVVSYITISQNDEVAIIKAIIVQDFIDESWQTGPSVIMLSMAFVVSMITIVAGFYARTPSITFVTWRKTQSIGSYEDEE